MDNRTLTRLLSFIADGYEARISMGRIKPELMVRLLNSKFPTLTTSQVKHIMRIL